MLSFHLAGARLVSSHSLHETSSVFMDGVAKPDGAAPKLASDASKVVAKGLGLNKGFVGQKSSFTVDCSKAGEWERLTDRTDSWETKGAIGKLLISFSFWLTSDSLESNAFLHGQLGCLI